MFTCETNTFHMRDKHVRRQTHFYMWRQVCLLEGTNVFLHAKTSVFTRGDERIYTWRQVCLIAEMNALPQEKNAFIHGMNTFICGDKRFHMQRQACFTRRDDCRDKQIFTLGDKCVCSQR